MEHISNLVLGEFAEVIIFRNTQAHLHSLHHNVYLYPHMYHVSCIMYHVSSKYIYISSWAPSSSWLLGLLHCQRIERGRAGQRGTSSITRRLRPFHDTSRHLWNRILLEILTRKGWFHAHFDQDPHCIALEALAFNSLQYFSKIDVCTIIS